MFRPARVFKNRSTWSEGWWTPIFKPPSRSDASWDEVDETSVVFIIAESNLNSDNKDYITLHYISYFSQES